MLSMILQVGGVVNLFVGSLTATIFVHEIIIFDSGKFGFWYQ
jgi:hypothetical protein